MLPAILALLAVVGVGLYFAVQPKSLAAVAVLAVQHLDSHQLPHFIIVRSPDCREAATVHLVEQQVAVRQAGAPLQLRAVSLPCTTFFGSLPQEAPKGFQSE